MGGINIMKNLVRLSVLAAAALAVGGAAHAETIGFTTLQPGAINHLQAQIIGKVVQAHTDLQVRVIPVAGTTATLAAVQNRQAEITIGDVNNMGDAIRGTGMFTKLKPMPNLRVIVKLVDFPIGIMLRKDSNMIQAGRPEGQEVPDRLAGVSQRHAPEPGSLRQRRHDPERHQGDQRFRADAPSRRLCFG